MATLTGARGTATTRDAKRVVVEEDLKVERVYVETLANQDLANGPAIVASAGMYVKEAAGPSKADLAAKAGPEPGSVKLWAKHPGGDASFEWQWSTDGAEWVDAGESTQADFTIRHLVSMTLCSFRYRALLPQGLTDWSQTVTFRVP